MPLSTPGRSWKRLRRRSHYYKPPNALGLPQNLSETLRVRARNAVSPSSTGKSVQCCSRVKSMEQCVDAELAGIAKWGKATGKFHHRNSNRNDRVGRCHRHWSLLRIGNSTSTRRAGRSFRRVRHYRDNCPFHHAELGPYHIVSCFPRSGGPVGLAHLYVDPALAFALGWNAWYEWTIILPSEIAAAGVLMNTFLPPLNQLTDQLQLSLNMTWTSAFLVLALALNFIGARYYGMLETAFSAIKITTVTLVLISGIVLDLMKGADGHRLGFRYWNNPGAFKAYRSRDALGRFFGLWAVLLQACFSYFGTEVAAMAAAEVRNPRISIPNAARNAWIRISVFYVGSVFVAGLLVPSNDDALGPSNSASKRDSVFSSPFVIAFKNRGLLPVALAMAALFVFSAFSAAVSDVFISSRLLFFMSKCGHAPRWGSWTCNVRIRKLHLGVVPYSGVAVAGVFATLAYLTAADAEQAFHWLSTMTSTACLCSWIGMMWTYLSWDRGLQQAQHLASGGNQYYVDFFEKYKHRIPEPKRRWYRTLRAWYALIMCTLILIFNGWAVFTVPGEWIVARTPNDPPPPVDPDIGQPVPTFITSYLPVPMFLLLVFGYKLTSRTQSVTTERMVLNMKYEWDAEAEEDRVRELHAMSSTRTPSQPESNCLNRPTAILEFLAWSIYGLARGDSSANRR